MTIEQIKASINNQKALYELLKEVRETKQVWTHRASSTSVFLANPLHYALQQGLGVFFGSSDKTIIGSAVHAGVDFGYVNPNARIGLCIKALAEEVDVEMEKLKAELIGKVSKTELIKEAVRLFKVYYKEVLVNNRTQFVASEQYLKIDVPVEMYKNPNNFGRVQLTGTFDRLYKDEQGNYILGDLKTAKTAISGKVEKSQELQDLEAEIGSLEKSKKDLEKIVSKFENAEVKCKEIMDEKGVVQIAINDAKLNNKATKALENKLEKLSGEFDKWNDNLARFEDAQKELIALNSKLLKLQDIIAPLTTSYESEKAIADLEACKTQHGFQVALYSLMYMIVYGIEIKKVRLENVVKTKTAQIQIFEWELDEKTLNIAEDAIQMVVSTVEAFYDGVSPEILFRPNPFTYYGSETNELLESFWR